MKHAQSSKPGGKHRLALLTWAGVYPVLTLTALALDPILAGEPTPVRTLVMSAFMVPVMVYAVTPAANRVFGEWIAGAHDKAAASRKEFKL